MFTLNLASSVEMGAVEVAHRSKGKRSNAALLKECAAHAAVHTSGAAILTCCAHAALCCA